VSLRRELSVSHIFNGKENQFFTALSMMDPAGIEEHLPEAEMREIVLDLKIFKKSVFEYDLFEKLPQPRNVPLLVAEFIDKRSRGRSSGWVISSKVLRCNSSAV
jgi:hypothetical protein